MGVNVARRSACTGGLGADAPLLARLPVCLPVCLFILRLQSLFGRMMATQEDLETAAAAYMDKYLLENSVYSTKLDNTTERAASDAAAVSRDQQEGDLEAGTAGRGAGSVASRGSVGSRKGWFGGAEADNALEVAKTAGWFKQCRWVGREAGRKGREGVRRGEAVGGGWCDWGVGRVDEQGGMFGAGYASGSSPAGVGFWMCAQLCAVTRTIECCSLTQRCQQRRLASVLSAHKTPCTAVTAVALRRVLLWRELLSVTRNPADVAGRCLIFTWLAVFVGLIFYNLPTTVDALRSRMNVLFVEPVILLLMPYVYMSLFTSDKQYFIQGVCGGSGAWG